MINVTKFFTGLLLKLLLVALLLSTENSQAQSKHTSVNVNSRNGKTTISVKNGKRHSFSLEYEGEITLSDDDKDVIAISNGGYMEIKKSAFGSRRRIFMESDNNGRLIKKYYIGSSEEPFANEGKAWLAEVLPDVLRSSTLAAKQRVDRFYTQGGTTAVLREVDLIDSDYVKSAYIKLLLDKNPKNSDLISILRVVGSDINSDHHQAQILKHNTKAFLTSDATTAAYIEATGKINSDHHQSDVLKRSIRDGDISEAQMKSLFAITKNINSDHHKASVLREVMKNRSLSNENIELLISASRDINSDHHKAQVLKTALATAELSKSGYSAFLRSMSDISSDHHCASVLSELLDNKLDSNSLGELLELAHDNMSSDHHQATVLKKVVQKQALDGESLTVLLRALKGMSSDVHQSSVFNELSKERFTDGELTQILDATRSIGSDHHQSNTLISFAPAVRNGDSTIKEAYREACNSISSELHYGKAIRAIQ